MAGSACGGVQAGGAGGMVGWGVPSAVWGCVVKVRGGKGSQTGRNNQCVVRVRRRAGGVVAEGAGCAVAVCGRQRVGQAAVWAGEATCVCVCRAWCVCKSRCVRVVRQGVGSRVGQPVHVYAKGQCMRCAAM